MAIFMVAKGYGYCMRWQRKSWAIPFRKQIRSFFWPLGDALLSPSQQPEAFKALSARDTWDDGPDNNTHTASLLVVILSAAQRQSNDALHCKDRKKLPQWIYGQPWLTISFKENILPEKGWDLMTNQLIMSLEVWWQLKFHSIYGKSG